MLFLKRISLVRLKEIFGKLFLAEAIKNVTLERFK